MDTYNIFKDFTKCERFKGNDNEYISCNDRECEYIEVKHFINLINQESEKNFEIVDCPDKKKKKDEQNKEYTCDIVLNDKKSDENIYIEIKRVMHAYNYEPPKKKDRDNGEGKNVSSNEHTNDYVNLIYDILDYIIYKTDNKEKVIYVALNYCMYLEKMPSKLRLKTDKYSFIGENKLMNFYKEFRKFIETEYFGEDIIEFKFEFEEEEEENITIKFEKKTDEFIKDFGKTIIIEFDTTGGTKSVNKILENLNDYKNLKKLIIKNIDKIIKESDYKFKGAQGRKIALNVIQMPTGYSLFFNFFVIETCMKAISELEIKEAEVNFDEAYLLYYSDKYIEIKGSEKDGIIEQSDEKEVLFIFPLFNKNNNKAIFEEPIKYEFVE